MGNSDSSALTVAGLAIEKNCSAGTVYRRIRLGQLPKPIEIRPGVSGWLRDDLEPFLTNWKFSPTGERSRRAFGVAS